VTEKKGETLGQIEETQRALQDSIDQAKKLASESERLIKRHKKELSDEGE